MDGVAVLIAIVWYIDFVLQLFPWTRWLSVRLYHLLMDPLCAIGQDVSIFLWVVFSLGRRRSSVTSWPDTP